MRVLLIGNPAAGLRPAPRLLESLRGRLEIDGIRADIHETAASGEATAAARSASGRGGYDAVLAVGGDGTAHEVANGLVGSDLPMGVVPAGTMNILARELGLPMDPLRSVDGLKSFRPVPVTTGRAGERHFLLMCGVGFDAYALDRALAVAGGGKVTFRGYVRAGLSAAWRYRLRPLEVLADGERLTGSSAIVGNVSMYGGKLRITPRADPLDPFLDLCLLLPRAVSGYVRVFCSVLAGGRHVTGRDVAYRKARRVEIRPAGDDPDPAPVQMDGEPAGRLPVVLEARPRSLRILAPPAWRG